MPAKSAQERRNKMNMNQQISSYFCPTRIIMGNESYRRLSDFISEFGTSKVFMAVDAALLKTAFVNDIFEMLKAADVDYSVFSEIEPDPSADSVEKALEISRALDAGLVLAVGGGSTIDVAKAVAIVSTNGGRIHDYEGIEKFTIPPLPLIAIPTTAGTGSEVSGSCVITDTVRGLKMSIRHASLNPARIAILDPLALRTVPPSVACHSGLDAIGLDDGRQLEFGRLERIEALAAGLALAPAPDRRAVFGNARIDDAGVLVLAEGTMHARLRGS